ncbi:MAG TPA: M48 family metallopeptidase [Terriglobales bacterium]|nr:M48 family metallopeptidase [Terriglobales bacterium]
MKSSLLFLICLFALALSEAQTQPAANTPAAQPPSAQPTDSTQQTPILEYSPPPAEYARAKEYSRNHYKHFFFDAFWGFLILLVVLRWRVAPAFRNLAERVSKRRFVQLIIFAPLTLLAISIPELATDINDQRLDLAFGVSVQKWAAWFSDWITNQIIMLIVGTILVGILYAVIRRSPRRWWFYFWLASIPLILIMFFLQPLVIDPLFFKFTPLADTQPVLTSEMRKVMHHGGIDIPPARMFLMNASTKTTQLNAYVTGFGQSKRVVIWDTTINKGGVEGTLFVFGHEMGHYVLLHIPKEIAIISVMLLVLLYLGFRFANWMLARFGYQWGIRGIDDWASLPALMFVITLLAFLATPAFNAESRYFEHEADRYGIEVTHGIVPDANQVAAHYFEKSGENNLSDPDPNWFTKAWFFDHPTRPERVHFVATYDPWSQGKEPEYVK